MAALYRGPVREGGRFHKTGTTPKEMIQAIKEDPTIRQDLLSVNKGIPDALAPREEAKPEVQGTQEGQAPQEAQGTQEARPAEFETLDNDYLASVGKEGFPEGRSTYTEEFPPPLDDRTIEAQSRETAAEEAQADAQTLSAAEDVEAQNRYDQRAELVREYTDQLQATGLFSDEKIASYGQVLAAHAERMSEVFGLTPQEYLNRRFAGYYAVSQEEFVRLAETGIDGLFENRALADYLQSLGVTRNMSKAQRRMALQPEFAYAYGRVNPESIQHIYGERVQ